MTTAKSKKQKGIELENYVSDQIVAKGLDDRAKRDGASGAGTREKADISTSLMILGQNAGIECKNWKVASVKSWWEQACKLESLNREPVVVYKLINERYSDTKAIIRLDTLLELIKHQKDQDEIDNIIAGTNYEKRNLLFKIRDAKTTMAKLITYLKD